MQGRDGLGLGGAGLRRWRLLLVLSQCGGAGHLQQSRRDDDGE
jgi:hypothetical protein